MRYKRASPPHIEQDYDEYQNMLARSTTGSQKDDVGVDVFHDASEGTGPTSHPTLNQQQPLASTEGGKSKQQMAMASACRVC